MTDPRLTKLAKLLIGYSTGLKKGDRVLFGKYSGSEIKLDGEELLIMREDEILGIIERAGAATSGSKKSGK